MDMLQPCPFRIDCGGYLTKARAQQIGKALTENGGAFPCHKTTKCVEDDDGFSEMVTTESSQHCAGALLMLENEGRAPENQMVRIAERLGLYDHTKLDRSAPVVKSVAEFVQLHGGGR